MGVYIRSNPLNSTLELITSSNQPYLLYIFIIHMIAEVQYMKFFSYSKPNRTPITELTDDQIAALPERFLCVTRTPGRSSYLPVFAVVKKI